MFSIAPMPAFNETPWGHYRPAAPSPLSSSPIRAPPPLSPVDGNSAPQRNCFSSPPGPPSKFATRPAKPNPLSRKREDGQQARRSLFLKNVRDRADDKAWQRRSIEGQAIRTWYEEQRELARRKERDTTSVPSEADIEDATAMAAADQHDYDAMMVDDVARQEEAELEALLAEMEQAQSMSAPQPRADPTQRPPPGCYLEDGDEYEEIFMQLAQNEPGNGDAMDTC